METPVRSKIRPKLLAVGVGSFVLSLGAVSSLKHGLGPAPPVGAALALLLAVSFVTWMLAIGPEERAEDEASPGEAESEEVTTEEERVRSYREGQFLALGVSDEIATVLAARPMVSVHDLARLIEKGCPANTAVRILWPD